MNDRYAWAGGEEAMLRFGPATGPVAMIALPLFEEANRTRAFAVTLCRALAAREVASALPDVPGQGESLTPLESLSLAQMRAGYASAVEAVRGEGRAVYGVGIRSGALLDETDRLRGRWQLAPQNGPALSNDLRRLRQLGGERAFGAHWWRSGDNDTPASDRPIAIAGNLVSPRLLAELIDEDAPDPTAIPTRVVRLASDPAPADRRVEAAPLWRRAEPDNDPALAALLADDIAAWIGTVEATCAA